ncbi:MAG: Restriction endonuclease [Pedosphaera sp.]|nr:Restriction endonuclease [Pedosphaera sp.]
MLQRCGSGLFGFGLCFGSVTGRCGHAPSPKLRPKTKHPRSSSPHHFCQRSSVSRRDNGTVPAYSSRIMGRKKRSDDWWVAPVLQIGGLIAAAAIFVPGVRQMIQAAAVLGGVMAGLVLVVTLVFLLIRKHKLEDSRLQAAVSSRTASWVPPLPQATVPRSSRASLPPPDLLAQLHTIDWFQFEKVVEALYQKLGYQVTRRGGANPDGGIDLILEQNGQRTAIQCKHWKSWNVNVRGIREFLGALTHAGIERGIFITLRGYTGEAKQLAQEHGIEFLDESGLAKLLDQANARFDPDLIAILQDTRKFCPKCESRMVLRTAKKGPNAGGNFWGCSRYPKCRYML